MQNNARHVIHEDKSVRVSKGFDSLPYQYFHRSDRKCSKRGTDKYCASRRTRSVEVT
jgi:hypothetical protein